MTDLVLNTLDDLAQGVRSLYPAARVEVHHFPSGAAMLDVLLAERFFVVGYQPSEGYAASEVRAGEGFLDHDHRFDSLDDAKEFLVGMLTAVAAIPRTNHDAGKANLRAV